MQEDRLEKTRSSQARPGEIDLSDYLHVENNGSDVTVFSFAGAAVLFAGMPQFEFKKLLAEHGKGYNLVFLRDPQRSAFTKAPDGSYRGLKFFQGLIGDVMEELGSSYNVALGASAGGSGAFYLSTQMPIQQLITFSPAFPSSAYTDPATPRRAFFDFKKLLMEPKAYFEVLFVTLGARFIWRKVSKAVGEENIPDLARLYAETKPVPPRATIFYGRRCRPDSAQAESLRHLPTIRLRPVESGRHNCAADLKKQGILGKVIMDEIEAGLHEWRAAHAVLEPAFAQAER